MANKYRPDRPCIKSPSKAGRDDDIPRWGVEKLLSTYTSLIRANARLNKQDIQDVIVAL
jgi:hypothetical protein